MKVELKLTVDLGDDFIDPHDNDEREWLINEVLNNTNELYLHSNYIGDGLGDVTKVEDIKLIY